MTDAVACPRALAGDTSGFVSRIIANHDAMVDATSQEAISRFLPDAPVDGHREGHQSVLSNELTKVVMGAEPALGWRR